MSTAANRAAYGSGPGPGAVAGRSPMGAIQPRAGISLAAQAQSHASAVANAKASATATATGSGVSRGPAGTAPVTVNASRKAPPAPSSASGSASSRRAPAVHHTNQQQAHPHSQQPQPAARPSTRLEREKKKDFADPENIGPWKLGAVIGTGASGRVRLAHHVKHGTRVAVKIIPRHQLENKNGGGGGAGPAPGTEAQKRLEKMEIGIEREIIVMKLIKHDNLLSLIDVYETKKVLYLIMEYVEGGELFDHLVACGRLEVDSARAYFRQIMFGVDHCHSFNICHRDLKPENLLLSKDKSQVKVADFGMAALQHSGRMLETSCGSPHYASPEIVSGRAYVGTSTDIWSCGIILFALLCGKLPFDDPNMSTLLQKVKDGKFEMPKHLRDEDAKDLICKMLVVDPRKRYTMKEIFAHDWFTNHGKLSSTNPVQVVADDLPVELPLVGLDDDDIFRGLTYLFQGVSRDELRAQLLSKADNWPKRFYKLLLRNQTAADEEECSDDEGASAQQQQLQQQQQQQQQRQQKQQQAQLVKQQQRSSSSGSRPTKAAVTTTTSSFSAAASTASTTVTNGGRDDRARPRRSLDKDQTQTQTTRTSSVSRTPGQHQRTPVLNRRSSAEPYSSPSARTADGDSAAARGSPRATAANSYASTGPGSRSSFDHPRANATPSAYDTPQSLRHQRSSVDGTPTRGVPQITFRGATPGTDGLDAGLASAKDAVTPAATHGANMGTGAISNASNAILGAGTSAGASGAAAGYKRQAAASVPISRAGSLRPPSRPASPDKALSNRPTSSIQQPVIPVPSVGDAAVQHFLKEVADELASIRASGADPGRADRLQAKMHRAQVSGWLSPRSVGATSPSPAADVRFEDADDDRSEAGSYRSGTDSSSPYTPTSPLPPVLYGGPETIVAPLTIADKGKARTGDVPVSPRKRSSQLSIDSQGNTNAHANTMVARSSTRRSATSTRASVFSTGTSHSNDSERLSVVMGGGARASGITSRDEIGMPYEQTRPGPSPLRIESKSKAATAGQPAGLTRLQQKNPGLGLDLKAASGTVESTVSSPVASTVSSEFSSPRQASWFGSIFNWKPSSFTLNSIENLTVTLETAKKLLQSFGVVTSVENSEHAPVLKCSALDVKDSTGRLTANKQVRFRIEFVILPIVSAAGAPSSPNRLSVASPTLSTYSDSSSGSGGAGGARRANSIRASSIYSAAGSAAGGAAGVYATKVKITQEKGSNNTLKTIFALLREQWTLDMLARSPDARSSIYSASPNM
ncbi:Pkinase-domain-containing protein [Tilletiaria anomala UBC 951]|uniref:non-specific serine/threonine protein kinase n=1 Tax=Tilletiaria anomala (strain ATCC 24038 / CBS 436.72 / UBC 951) TaxID=1037660 RepID=A0A066WIG5_TILAU|nr:Pkinase-domain-containing protein [Tilletiaria anomala UBC 951]KDN52313.1 Pkinase-domain-containing protein [Tilletiaria anomala UBC 951]